MRHDEENEDTESTDAETEQSGEEAGESSGEDASGEVTEEAGDQEEQADDSGEEEQEEYAAAGGGGGDDPDDGGAGQEYEEESSDTDDTERDADDESGFSESDDTERDADDESGFSDDADTERDADDEPGLSDGAPDEDAGESPEEPGHSDRHGRPRDSSARDSADERSKGKGPARPPSSTDSAGERSKGPARPPSPTGSAKRPVSASGSHAGPSHAAAPVPVPTLYANPGDRRRFLRWAAESYRHNDVLFLYAVLAYRRSPTAARAAFIARMFLAQGAPLEPNLSSEGAALVPHAIGASHQGHRSAFDLLFARVEVDVNANLTHTYGSYSGDPKPLRPISVGRGETLLAAAKAAGFTAADLGLDGA